MSESENTSIIITALARVLKPIARLMLRHGVSFQIFSDVAKKVFVEVAAADFALDGKKQTSARIALLTGVNRKEVAKLIKDVDGAEPREEYVHPVSRIVSGWLYDPAFQDSSGEPALLALEQGDKSFDALVKKFGKDITMRSALDELKNNKVIALHGEMVELIDRVYLSNSDSYQQLRMFGNASYDLLSTLDHNLNSQNDVKRLQRSVIYTNVPVEASQLINARATKEGQVFLESINKWLSDYDRDSNPDIVGSGKLRAGVGIYYFEEDIEDSGESS